MTVVRNVAWCIHVRARVCAPFACSRASVQPQGPQSFVTTAPGEMSVELVWSSVRHNYCLWHYYILCMYQSYSTSTPRTTPSNVVDAEPNDGVSRHVSRSGVYRRSFSLLCFDVTRDRAVSLTGHSVVRLLRPC